MRVGVGVKGWGARLMMAPGLRGKKWAEVMVLRLARPVRVRVPSGAMVEGGLIAGTAMGPRGPVNIGALLSGRVKWACSGTQMSLQTSQVASASRVLPVMFWAVKGRVMSPERT